MNRILKIIKYPLYYVTGRETWYLVKRDFKLSRFKIETETIGKFDKKSEYGWLKDDHGIKREYRDLNEWFNAVNNLLDNI
jgi:hypothetical protein